jgi:hypothetical protein
VLLLGWLKKAIFDNIATYRGSFFGVKSEFTKMPMAICMGMQLVWMFLDILNDLNNKNYKLCLQKIIQVDGKIKTACPLFLLNIKTSSYEKH